MNFTLYTADCIGNLKNCIYTNKIAIKDKETLIAAVGKDHVMASYKEGYRSKANFINSDVIPMDCDNDHSDNPKDWVTSVDVAMAFDGVSFAIVYSRNNMKAKGNKSARPRFHIYFPVEVITDRAKYTEIKQRIAAAFPYFDSNALDSARFLFGTEEPEVEFYDGSALITDYLEGLAFSNWDKELEKVPEGKRNSTMSHLAGKIIKRYGNTSEAHEIFMQAAEKCNPPLDENELSTIWRSATRFGSLVSVQKGYIAPEQYNADLRFKPLDYSDVGQATVMKKEYGDKLRYSPQTDYIVYNGSFWEESKPKAQAISQALTDKQLEEAESEMKRTRQELVKNGAMELLATMGPKKAVALFSKEQSRAYELYEEAAAYRNYALKRRESKNITSCLKEARPMLEINQRILDADEFLLNTPLGTYDLRVGLEKPREHKAEDYITKQTTVEPGEEGKDLWLKALDIFFCEDMELINYVQSIVGLAAIGKVYVEALIIAYGEGRNGKSTFWNVVSRVLGSYSGNISADMLTVGCRRNVKPELAEAKGKRLLIAAELEEGMRLNTSNVKQLCSTDEIYAEKKYKDPFSYIPTHTLVLYTNHLPRVGAIDAGTWRRLIVIPFDAKIEGSTDIKNYADFLYEKAGSAILAWVIEGAQMAITSEYKISNPARVDNAIKTYRENNDWLGHFLSECCEVGDGHMAKSGETYNNYRSYCMQSGEFIRSAADFYMALDSNGFERKKTKKGIVIRGLSLKSEFLGAGQ